MSDDFFKELQIDFYKESLDLIERFESVLLENEKPKPEHMNELFRIAHTIKGGSAAVGLEEVAKYTHKVEDFLSGIKSEKMTYSAKAASILLEFADILRNEFNAKIENQENDWSTSENLNQIANYKSESENLQQSTADNNSNSHEKKSKNTQVKVDNERLDSIFNTIGEVVILKNQLQEFFNTSNNHNTSHLSESLNFLVKDLYDKALGLRLTSIKPLFQRLQRTMRDLATQLDKDVHIELIGDDTEIDRSFFDILSEPLIHLVRNAIDHGIESKEARTKAEKSGKALIELKAYYQSGQIVIEIKDDGKGINIDTVFTKAKKQNLLPESAKIEDFNNDQIFNFIFLPGFSTAESLTSVSGRGVGLDVVKSAIERVHGKIFLESKLGHGTSFKLFLPMTTSLVDGVIFEVSQNRYIVPARSINTILNIRLSDLSYDPVGNPFYMYHQQPIPILNIRKYFKSVPSDSNNQILAISEDKSILFGCLFDKVIGQVQTVVKPTPEINKRAEFIGASVLGDGYTCLILDLASIRQKSQFTNEKNEMRLL